ncbi:MAG: TonB-dependent receptor [Sphingobium sp.]|nr:TonB-dependent receptor [Sphingobium sp.]MCP5400276.1 TonB-dependent receptor [Sphingomonas sp.]
MKNMTYEKFGILIVGAVALAPTMAWAQTSTSSDTRLEEIVVTAQKREQRGNDVGVSLSVLTSSEIKRAGINSLVDVSSQTPNLQMKNVLGNSITNVTIRGIGLNDYASNNNPAAGVYVDNVYLVSPAMLTFGFFDVERIEVLKGPQGDLYGRNTTAGAVNIISKKPTDTTEIEVETGYGSYQRWHLDGAVGGALTPTLDARFAVQTVQQNSGWQTNYVNGEKVGKVNRTSGRLQLAWKPQGDVRVLLNAHAGYERSEEMLNHVENVTTTENLPYLNKPYIAGSSVDPEMNVDSFGGSLTVDWTISPALTLTSISAYENYDRFNVRDVDGTSLVQLDYTAHNKIRQFSQELRLNYVSGDITLIGGAFYSHDVVEARDSYSIIDFLPSLGDTVGNTYRQRTEAYAGFLHAEWTLAPKFTLIGGLRYTHENKLFNNVTTFFGSNGNYIDVFPALSRSYSTSRVSGKIGLNYKPVDDTLIYASISRGFKSGGFQGQLTFDPAVITPFNDESITAYEVGVKSRLLPNLQFNAAIFDYEYHDAQFYGPIFNEPGIGVLFGLANVGNARVYGAEADIIWRPVSGLDLRFGVGTIDTKIIKSIVAGVADGSKLPNAPELTLNGLMRYNWALSDTIKADITLSGNYQSSMAFDVVLNPPEALNDGYFVGNSEVGLTFGEAWRASASVKNIFDKRYKTQAAVNSVGWGYGYGPPRTFSVNLAYKFH